jgi:hypothetical protein
MLATNSVATPYQAPGAPDGPGLYIASDAFNKVFCADSSPEKASVMGATRRPLSLAALTEKATAAGWKTIPSWYLVSNQDNAIRPKPRRSWPSGWVQQPSTSTVHIQHSSRSHPSPPRSL